MIKQGAVYINKNNIYIFHWVYLTTYRCLLNTFLFDFVPIFLYISKLKYKYLIKKLALTLAEC